jgi:hypothetical protein
MDKVTKRVWRYASIALLKLIFIIVLITISLVFVRISLTHIHASLHIPWSVLIFMSIYTTITGGIIIFGLICIAESWLEATRIQAQREIAEEEYTKQQECD